MMSLVLDSALPRGFTVLPSEPPDAVVAGGGAVAPVTLLGGPVLAYNVLAVLLPALAAWTAYQLCRHNVILSAGQVGIGVAGGTFIRVEDNLILGTRSDVANVGLYAWNQSELPSHDVVISGNRVSWMDHDGGNSDWWNGGGISAVQETGNHFGDDQLAKEMPAPPSHAPMPPRPFLSSDATGRTVARLPWKPQPQKAGLH